MRIQDLEGKTIKVINEFGGSIAISFTDGTRVALELHESYGGCETCGWGGSPATIEVTEV